MSGSQQTTYSKNRKTALFNGCFMRKVGNQSNWNSCNCTKCRKISKRVTGKLFNKNLIISPYSSITVIIVCVVNRCKFLKLYRKFIYYRNLLFTFLSNNK